MDLAHATDTLHNHGLRFTRLKRAVLQQFTDGECAFTAEEIGDRMGLGGERSALYRCLASLEEVGILTRLYLDDDCRRYDVADGFGAHHHHLVCTACAAIQRFDGCLLDGAATSRLSTTGFLVRDHQLVLRGLCPQCRRGADAP
jgi:Fur family ferric uptake transcriptional regulator